MKFSSIV